MKCEHTWKTDDEEIEQRFINRFLTDDMNGNCYTSKFMIHYWEETECVKCGKKRLVSGTFDRKGIEPISEEEFERFNIFLTELNNRAGNIETKKKLVNFALDSMPWKHAPQFMMHNDDYNYFYISFNGDPRDQKPEERFDWDFYDALEMIGDMRKRENIMVAVNKAEKEHKENGGEVNDFENIQALMEALQKLMEDSSVVQLIQMEKKS